MRYKHYERSEQLCWTCKRCTNRDDLYCPWADKGEPVEGWTADLGKKYYHDSQDGKKIFIGRSYNIRECPLYIRDVEFERTSQFAEVVSKKYGITSATVYKSFRKYLEKYQEDVGVQLPRWLWYFNSGDGIEYSPRRKYPERTSSDD